MKTAIAGDAPDVRRDLYGLIVYRIVQLLIADATLVTVGERDGLLTLGLAVDGRLLFLHARDVTINPYWPPAGIWNPPDDPDE